MKVFVTNLYTDAERLYEGTPDMVENQLMVDYPFLRVPDVDARGDINDVLEHLESSQGFLVEVEEGDGLAKSEAPTDVHGVASSQIVQDMHGFNPYLTEAFRAGQFLAGGKDVSFEDFRRALWQEHEDMDAAALRAFGFDVNEQNLAALRAVKLMGDVKKSEIIPAPRKVVAGTPEAEDVAEAIGRAFKDSFVFEVMLAGKHSNGSLVARDEETHKTYLLKPGSGGAGSAAGSSQEGASQSAREAAWYHVAKEWGLYDHFPRAELVFLDGHAFAALELLSASYVTMEKRRETEPNIETKALQRPLQDGILHQWAIMDFVCGNPDRHGQNVMVDPDDNVKLIDHGSAFAGPAFDPAHDKNSFVPYYLRLRAPRNFNDLPLESKIGRLPRVSAAVEKVLRAWLARIDEGHLTAILHRYGIDPEPTLQRLSKLREAVKTLPVDDAINRLWVTI